MANIKYAPEEPICAIATALSPSALGIVRCSGKNCIELVSKVFSRPKALLSAEGNSIVYGWILDKPNNVANVDVRHREANRICHCEQNDIRHCKPKSNVNANESSVDANEPSVIANESSIIADESSVIASEPSVIASVAKQFLVKIDEVLISVFRAPKSFTGEDMAEISCHGGPGVVLAVQNVLLKNGFREAEKGEYTFRAFINGKADLTKAEAVREIIESHTSEGRSHAVGRLAGNLFSEIDSIKKLIKDTLASIEVEIEYPEDEETISDTFDKKNLEDALVRLENLKNSWRGEKLYQDGARVVLCGKTNAGKSSLFNAILKEDRAIVSDIEGTTRDWIESFVDFSGIPVRLFDTAGLRNTDDKIEAQGVQLSKNLSQDADVVLYLVDSSRGITKDDEKFLAECEKPCVLVWNKSDLENESSLRGLVVEQTRWLRFSKPPLLAHERSEVSPAEAISSANKTFKNVKREVKISAKKGSGFSELYDAVKSILTEGISTERVQAGLGSERQKICVEEALESVKHSLSVAETFTLDAVVQDLEDALNSLGEITGEVYADDVLESIFSNFCVGK